jgi:hypothetical protein
MITAGEQPQALRRLVEQFRFRQDTAADGNDDPFSSSSSRSMASAASALLRASRVAQARGNSPRFGVSSISAGRSASGSMPAWLTSASRRGDPEAKTNFGRPII